MKRLIVSLLLAVSVLLGVEAGVTGLRAHSVPGVTIHQNAGDVNPPWPDVPNTPPA